MGELFTVESHTITYYLKQIYKSGELQEDTTTRKIRVVKKEGNRDVTRLLAARQLPMKMADWIQKLDAFLQI